MARRRFSSPRASSGAGSRPCRVKAYPAPAALQPTRALLHTGMASERGRVGAIDRSPQLLDRALDLGQPAIGEEPNVGVHSAITNRAYPSFRWTAGAGRGRCGNPLIESGPLMSAAHREHHRATLICRICRHHAETPGWQRLAARGAALSTTLPTAAVDNLSLAVACSSHCSARRLRQRRRTPTMTELGTAKVYPRSCGSCVPT